VLLPTEARCPLPFGNTAWSRNLSQRLVREWELWQFNRIDPRFPAADAQSSDDQLVRHESMCRPTSTAKQGETCTYVRADCRGFLLFLGRRLNNVPRYIVKLLCDGKRLGRLRLVGLEQPFRASLAVCEKLSASVRARPAKGASQHRQRQSANSDNLSTRASMADLVCGSLTSICALLVLSTFLDD